MLTRTCYLQLVLYEPDVKCTLMSNSPLPDIEVMFLSSDLPSSGKQKQQKDVTPAPSMRIRLSRQRQTAEIARFIPSPDVAGGGKVRARGEWAKKSVAVRQRGKVWAVPADDLQSLVDEERRGVFRALDFVQDCEAFENVRHTSKS